MKKLALFSATSAILILSAASPAFAGAVTVPGPEAGVGLGAIGLIGGGYVYLKRRFNRR